jgi:hypothetical protein
MFTAACIAGPRARALTAAGLSVLQRGARQGAQSCSICLGPCSVVRKVGLLIRNARPTDKAIGSLGAARHCLALALCKDWRW